MFKLSYLKKNNIKQRNGGKIIPLNTKRIMTSENFYSYRDFMLKTSLKATSYTDGLLGNILCPFPLIF